MKAIEVEHLSFSYETGENEEKKNILHDLSFSVEQGESIAFIGPNGSGKSTLMKLLVALLEKDEGKITLLGQELNEDSVDDLRKKMGIIFQNPDNQFIGATVRDDIAFGLENRLIPHEDMEDIVREYALKVGMIDFLDKEPSSLSGGQKQRVAIAGALSMKPEIVYMDEATAMLDPKGRKEIMELTSLMKKENPNMTILMVTHHMEEALLCDRIIVLHEGKAYLEGTPLYVFSHEQELKEIGLDLPFNLKLKSALKKEDFSFDEDEDIKEIMKNICHA